jgi:hypothetical protein
MFIYVIYTECAILIYIQTNTYASMVASHACMYTYYHLNLGSPENRP